MIKIIKLRLNRIQLNFLNRKESLIIDIIFCTVSTLGTDNIISEYLIEFNSSYKFKYVEFQKIKLIKTAIKYNTL